MNRGIDPDKTLDVIDAALLWEQQVGETARQFEAFANYRDRRPAERSLAKVGQELGVSTTYVERLSAAHHWIARTAAWDREQDMLDRERRVRERREMDARQAEAAASAIRKLAEAIELLDVRTLKPLELARLLEVAVKTERLARGAFVAEAGMEQHPPILRADEIRRQLKNAGILADLESVIIPDLRAPAETSSHE